MIPAVLNPTLWIFAKGGKQESAGHLLGTRLGAQYSMLVLHSRHFRDEVTQQGWVISEDSRAHACSSSPRREILEPNTLVRISDRSGYIPRSWHIIPATRSSFNLFPSVDHLWSKYPYHVVDTQQIFVKRQVEYPGSENSWDFGREN